MQTNRDSTPTRMNAIFELHGIPVEIPPEIISPSKYNDELKTINDRVLKWKQNIDTSMIPKSFKQHRRKQIYETRANHI